MSTVTIMLNLPMAPSNMNIMVCKTGEVNRTVKKERNTLLLAWGRRDEPSPHCCFVSCCEALYIVKGGRTDWQMARNWTLNSMLNECVTCTRACWSHLSGCFIFTSPTTLLPFAFVSHRGRLNISCSLAQISIFVFLLEYLGRKFSRHHGKAERRGIIWNSFFLLEFPKN